MTGKKTPKKTRTVEAAAVLLDATASKQMNIVPLNKALFYLDLVCLRDLGRLATDGKYVALDLGPVVSNYPRALVNRLTRLGIAERVHVDEYAKPLKLVALPNRELIDDEVEKKAVRLASIIERRSASELSARSHFNIGWRIAYNAGQGKGLPARRINMKIAMQQICVDNDPWMEEPLDMNSVFETSEECLVDWV